MPRFGVAFNRRRSTVTSEDFQHGQVAPDQPSFRVIERNDPSLNKSFDGGARMAARASGGHVPRPSQLELDVEDNMFAELKSGNRGSGASNTTKATSTDTSSRHSNASTAPSSTDMDDSKNAVKKNLHDIGARAAPKSSGSGFLNRAGRTFSFGVNKKNSHSSHDSNPEVPPVPTIQHQDFTGRARGMTDSTTSTATPPTLEENGNLDMGGDFGSMFSSFDKRASMATLKNLENSAAAPRSLTGNRSAQPAPLSINKPTRVESSPATWNSAGRNSEDNLLGSDPASPDIDVPPPVPRHQSSFKTSSRPSDIIEDEDAKLLQDSIVIGRLLNDTNTSNMNNSNNFYSNPRSPRLQRDEDTFSSSFARKPVNSSFKKGDDNLFEGTLAHSSRIAHRYASRAPSPPRNKVMTPAQFEKYRKDKERSTDSIQPTTTNDDDEDEINYDDDDDEIEKSKQQTKQRRKQEAHMAVYRQQMMKVTGEQPDLHPVERPPLPSSMSAPQLHLMKKTPSPGPTGVSDEDEDDEVPLAILAAHGFPNKNRPPTRLSTMGSNPNLRASMQPPPNRPGSAMGDAPTTNTQRHSTLPAFARNLPQDPFVGASINKPAIRESLQFSNSTQLQPPPPPPPQALPVGGLVGVIANEERSRAMRRGSPNIDGQKLIPGITNPAFDPLSGIPPHMMYNGMGGMPGMGQMPQPSLSVGDQAQLQMTQQMSQFMQMQMQFMQMMAANNQQPQQQAMGMPMPQMQNPYGGLGATQSMNDLSSRHSMMFEPSMEPPRMMDPNMRTMSMVQPPPNLGSFGQPQPGYAGSIRGGGGMGYTPSIAPSERSNIGLPGRYRPVSQLNPLGNDNHRRTNTMSGALGRWDENVTVTPKATINIVKPSDNSDDEDDEEGWEAMKAKRDKKRTMWKTKKGLGSELSAMI